ncbi:MAG: deaminase [bacterium]|nr:deaminase [bacterium]
MKYITDKKELEETEYYMKLAEKEAKKSTCRKSQRGAIIVKDGKVIGKGYNKVTLEKLCNPCIREKIRDNSRVELCSAIHAEQMAMIDAVNSGQTLKEARMYHTKVKKGEVVPCNDLSCTVCSRMIYEAGIDFVLWHSKGYALYDPEELNRLSFNCFLKD